MYFAINKIHGKSKVSTINLYSVEKIFDAIKQHLGFRKDTELAAWVGVSNKLLWNWKNKNAIADLSVFTRKGISELWLRTGRGNMLVSPSEATPDQWKEITEINKTKYEAGQAIQSEVRENDQELLAYARQLEEILKPLENKFDRGIVAMEAFKMMQQRVKQKKEEGE